MNTEDLMQRVALLLEAATARLEVTDSVLAAVIATHPDPGAVLRQWQPVVAQATTDQTLSEVTGATHLNPHRKAAMEFQVRFWTDILQGIAKHGPAPERP